MSYDKLTTLFDKQDEKTKVAITALTASLITASGVLGYQAYVRHRKNSKRKKNKQDIESSPLDVEEKYNNNIFLPNIQSHHNIINTSLTGEQILFNNNKVDWQQTQQSSFVIIVGAGGVGSWAALMLLRAGIKKLRIIDFDQVTLSSLNRHAVATLEDVGTPKVLTMKRHFEKINASHQCDIDARIELFNADNADDLLSGHPDYVIDAIDNINTKIDLIQYCYDHHLQVISSMGAGAKADPSRIQITDISETLEDPLARAVRKHLKKRNIEGGVSVAYSTEKPHHVKLLPLDEENITEADEFAALPDFRARILPVLGTIPSMFGMAIANHVILQLTKYPGYSPLPIKLRDGLYFRLHRDLLAREMKLFKTKTCLLDPRDVGFIFEEVWHGKSALSGPQKQLALVRWDKTKPLSILNAVCMSREECKKHDKLSADVNLLNEYGKETIDRIEKKFEEVKEMCKIWDNAL